MPHADVTEGIEHALMGENTVGKRDLCARLVERWHGRTPVKD